MGGERIGHFLPAPSLLQACLSQPVATSFQTPLLPGGPSPVVTALLGSNDDISNPAPSGQGMVIAGYCF